jgi:hypothetical protein
LSGLLFWIIVSVSLVLAFTWNNDNSIVFVASGQTSLPDGSIKEVITKDWMQFYMSEVKVKTGTIEKEIEVSYIVKNLDDSPQKFGGPFNGIISLTDDKGVSHHSEQSNANSFTPFVLSSTPNLLIPKFDIVKGTAIFRIPISSNPVSFSYTQSDIPFPQSPKVRIDLTKTMSPTDEQPKSDWVLGSNIGYSARIDPLDLTIDDERYSQDNLNYILTVTFKNTGSHGLTPHSNEISVQDQNGDFLTINTNHPQFTFKDKYLDPGQMVSGNIVFDNTLTNDETSKMVIWAPNTFELVNSGRLASIQ